MPQLRIWNKTTYRHSFPTACIIPPKSIRMWASFPIFVVILIIVVKAVLESIPGIVTIAASSAIPSAKEMRHEAKACAFCSWYERSSEQCHIQHAHTDTYGGDAYSCPYYEKRVM